jgi:hypothetical protein
VANRALQTIHTNDTTKQINDHEPLIVDDLEDPLDYPTLELDWEDEELIASILEENGYNNKENQGPTHTTPTNGEY